jgi:hypothetical protein
LCHASSELDLARSLQQQYRGERRDEGEENPAFIHNSREGGHRISIKMQQ